MDRRVKYLKSFRSTSTVQTQKQTLIHREIIVQNAPILRCTK